MSRIILFDVDQTLLYSGGAGSLAMGRAFHELYGIEDGFRRVEFSGRTDGAILRDAMRQHGLLDADARSGRTEDFPRESVRFQEIYYRLLPQSLQEAKGGHTKPGVPELLAALSARAGARPRLPDGQVPDGQVRVGLATGNFRRAAFMKLRHFGLDGYLAEGGFADDAEDRSELVGVAIERVAGGAPTDPQSAWVIGDTPLDIDAARSNGARALGVATGSTSIEELRAAGADAALPDLSDTDAVLATLLG